MKKILSLIVVVLLVYSIFWYYKADEAKKRIEDTLAKLEKSESSPGGSFHHAGISVTGYPFAIDVAVKKPRLKFKVQSEKENEEMQVEIFLDGTQTIGENILGNKYWIERAGDVHVLMNQNPTDAKAEPEHYMIGGQSRLSFKTKDYHPFDAFAHFFQTFADLEEGKVTFTEVIDRFKEGTFDAHGVTVYEMNKQSTKFLAFDKLQWDLSQAPKGKDLKEYTYEFLLKGFEVFEGLANVLKESDPANSVGKTSHLFYPYVDAGKTDFEWDGSLVLPADLSLNDERSFLDLPGFAYRITNCNAKNNFGSYSVTGAFDLSHPKEGNSDIHLDFDSVSETTPEGYKYGVKNLISMLQQFANDPSNESLEEKENIKKILSCCEEDIKKIVPDFSEQGMMKFLGDLDVSIFKEENNDVVKAKLDHFDLTTDLYGIRNSGAGKYQNGLANGQYTIDFLNYRDMLKDLVSYYNRAHFLFDLIYADQKDKIPPMVTAKMTEDTLNFLKAISNDPKSDSKDLSVTIDFRNLTNIKIGTLTAGEYQMEVQKYQGELLKELSK